MSSSSSPIISFEHFDSQFEFGNLDVNGKPIRPRKKPGRKPNPPSPALRKAQNRAAQRAFRERKRREMKEAETTVKQCLKLRDQALYESHRLRNKVEELCYENKYLKGQLLTLKIACSANRVDVPKLWDVDTQDGTDNYDLVVQSRTKGIPQPMEIFLDKDRNIINLIQHDMSSASVILSTLSPQPLNPFVCSSPSTMVDLHQYETSSLPDPNNDFLSPSTYLSTLPKSNTDSSHMAHYLGKLRVPSIDELLELTVIDDSTVQLHPNHWLQQQDLQPNHLAVLAQAITTDNSQLESNDQKRIMGNDNLTTIKQGDTGMDGLMNIKTEADIDPKTGLERIKTDIVDEGDDHATVTPLTSTEPRLQYARPMKPLEALEFIQTVQELDNNTRSLLKPTELQRTIAHDSRIDYVPGPMIRDLMILYQDFYDANELFALLVESCTFMGGDLRNPDCWNVSPSYLRKYWFLCPNHRHQRSDTMVDISAGLGQDMIKMMMERKAMYSERERFADHFPSDPDGALNHQHQPSHYQQTQQQHEHEQLYGRDNMASDAFAGYDLSSNGPLMSMMDYSDLFIFL